MNTILEETLKGLEESKHSILAQIKNLTTSLTKRREDLAEVENLILKLLAYDPAKKVVHKHDVVTSKQKKIARKKKINKPYPKGPPITDEQIREFIADMGKFTSKNLAEYFDRTTSWARLRLPTFENEGIVIAHKGDSLTSPTIYEYVPPQEVVRQPIPNRPKVQEPILPERGSPVPGVNRNKDTNNKDLAVMLNIARKQGFKISSTGKHIKVVNKTGQCAIVSSTPGGSIFHKTKRDLENIGVKF